MQSRRPSGRPESELLQAFPVTIGGFVDAVEFAPATEKRVDAGWCDRLLLAVEVLETDAGRECAEDRETGDNHRRTILHRQAAADEFEQAWEFREREIGGLCIGIGFGIVLFDAYCRNSGNGAEVFPLRSCLVRLNRLCGKPIPQRLKDI